MEIDAEKQREEIRRTQRNEKRTYGIIEQINDISHPVDDS